MKKEKYLKKIQGADPVQEKIIKALVGVEYQNLVEIYDDFGEDFHDHVELEEFIKYCITFNDNFIEIYLADIDMVFKIDGMWISLWDFTCYGDLASL